MKNLVAILTLLFTGVLSANSGRFPEVGDQAKFSLVINGSFNTFNTYEIVEVDRVNNRLKVQISSSAGNQKVGWAPLTHEYTEPMDSTKCSLMGGSFGKVTVDAGSFEACKIEYEHKESERNDGVLEYRHVSIKAWVGDVPVGGILKEERIYRDDGTTMNLELTSYSFANGNN